MTTLLHPDAILRGHLCDVQSLAFVDLPALPPRAALLLLASGSLDGIACLWDVAFPSSAVLSWVAHGGGVMCLASPEAGELWSQGRDGWVYRWALRVEMQGLLPPLCTAALPVGFGSFCRMSLLPRASAAGGLLVAVPSLDSERVEVWALARGREGATDAREQMLPVHAATAAHGMGTGGFARLAVMCAPRRRRQRPRGGEGEDAGEGGAAEGGPSAVLRPDGPCVYVQDADYATGGLGAGEDDDEEEAAGGGGQAPGAGAPPEEAALGGGQAPGAGAPPASSGGALERLRRGTGMLMCIALVPAAPPDDAAASPSGAAEGVAAGASPRARAAERVPARRTPEAPPGEGAAGGRPSPPAGPSHPHLHSLRELLAAGASERAGAAGAPGGGAAALGGDGGAPAAGADAGEPQFLLAAAWEDGRVYLFADRPAAVHSGVTVGEASAPALGGSEVSVRAEDAPAPGGGGSGPAAARTPAAPAPPRAGLKALRASESAEGGFPPVSLPEGEPAEGGGPAEALCGSAPAGGAGLAAPAAGARARLRLQPPPPPGCAFVGAPLADLPLFAPGEPILAFALAWDGRGSLAGAAGGPGGALRSFWASPASRCGGAGRERLLATPGVSALVALRGCGDAGAPAFLSGGWDGRLRLWGAAGGGSGEACAGGRAAAGDTWRSHRLAPPAAALPPLAALAWHTSSVYALAAVGAARAAGAPAEADSEDEREAAGAPPTWRVASGAKDGRIALWTL